MRKNRYELMDEECLGKLNREVIPKFGARSGITSGSFFLEKGQKLKCYIAVGETNTHKTEVELKRIGETVKEITGAHEVYCMGIKVA